MSLNVVIVGAGIVGLAHAWSAARRGHRVTICERDARARGASVRNFGMIWPIGQPAGELRELALRSRAAWLELAGQAGIWVDVCGSLHLAYRSDEWAVLEEFVEHAKGRDIECRLLTPSEVHERTPAAHPDGLLGGLYSPTELCVNPRRAVARLPHWLNERWEVRLEFAAPAVAVEENGAEGGIVRLAGGRQLPFDRLVVCGGADLATLYPERLATSGLRRCKLQMLKTGPLRFARPWGPHLAGGLTLRHYKNFEVCATLPELQERIAQETPELDRYGIHVMAARNEAGEVVLGDSHEYDERIEPFDKARIDDLILRELRKLIRLPDWTIAERWHGVYAKHPTRPLWEDVPTPCIRLCTGTGGAGMTMAFGLAERGWNTWEGWNE